MDNSVPEESVVMSDASFAGTPTPTPPPSPTNSGTTTSIPKSNNRNTGKIVATIFGLLLIIGGAAAGVVLVQNQQHLGQSAASGCTVTYNGTSSFILANGTSSSDCADVPVQKFNGPSCPTALNPEPVTFPGAGTYAPNPADGSCQQVDFQKNLNLPGGGVCSCKAPVLKTCGQACIKDSD